MLNWIFFFLLYKIQKTFKGIIRNNKVKSRHNLEPVANLSW